MYEVELGDVKVTIGNTLRIEYFGQEVPALVLPSKQFKAPTKELCIFPAFPSNYPITDTKLGFFIKSALKFV